MKKIPFLLCTALALVSCVSSPPQPQAADGKLQAIVSELKTLKLAPGELWLRDIVESPDTWNVSPQAAAAAMLSLDGWFDFYAKLGVEPIGELSKALFAGLPKLGAPGDLRVVAIGGVYGGESPLIVIVSQFKLREGILADQDFALDYLTNSAKFRTEDKETKALRNVGLGLMLDHNTTLSRQVVPRPDGHLVFAGNLNLGKHKVSEALDPLERANLMDTFIKDEIEANDDSIPALYESVKATAGVDETILWAAELNWGLYLFKRGLVDEAESHWASLSVPQGTNPSMLTVIDRDIPLLLGTARAWR
ncbi:MAG: hypothetical protein KKA67_01895 [Spirochaetes bacterium]|nr:hypothetical protein [Spirochaetota bacterium]MBU1079047.1 hypothetical protein [Spirochaetota bacterium]